MIHYRNDVRASGVDGRALVATAKRLLAAIGEGASGLSLLLVGDDAIRALNRKYRRRDCATDVLSFQLDETPQAVPEPLLGDIVISVETARRQAAAYDAPLQREIYRLLIHGLLHLKGHDHLAVAQRRTMQREERRLADAIALPWPYASLR